MSADNNENALDRDILAARIEQLQSFDHSDLLYWVAVVAAAAAATMLVPGWFGRPLWGWIVLALAGIGTAASHLLELHRSPPSLAIHAIIGTGALVSGVVLLLCAMGRVILFGDWAAVAIGIGGLLLGGLIAIGALITAIEKCNRSSWP